MGGEKNAIIEALVVMGKCKFGEPASAFVLFYFFYIPFKTLH